MSLLPERTEPADATLVRTIVRPAPNALPQQPTVRRGFFRTVGALLGLCRDYSVDDLGRLKEAGIQVVQAKARRERAEAEAKFAEAAKLYAEAELVRQQAARSTAESRDLERKSRSQQLRDIADASERMSAAITRIRQQGGNVILNEAQLRSLVQRGLLEFPDDHSLRDAADDEPHASGDVA